MSAAADNASAPIAKPSEYFTFALYFSEKKSRQLCEFLDTYPFRKAPSSSTASSDTAVVSSLEDSGAVVPQLGTHQRIRGVKLIVDDVADRRAAAAGVAEDEGGANASPLRYVDADFPHLSIRLVDNTGCLVDPRLVDALLQKASVDKDEGREDKIMAIQRFCDVHQIRIVDPFAASMPLVSSREYIFSRLSGGPADGEGLMWGKAAFEMLDYWGFLIPSTYAFGLDSSAREAGGGGDNGSSASSKATAIVPKVLFEEPNAWCKSDVTILKPEVASQRSYSHDLIVVKTEALLDAMSEGATAVEELIDSSSTIHQTQTANAKSEEKGGGSSESAPSACCPAMSQQCRRWIAQDCLSLLSLPLLYKVYVAGDYLSVMLYNASGFNSEVVGPVAAAEARHRHRPLPHMTRDRSATIAEEGEDEEASGVLPSHPSSSALPAAVLMKDGAKDLFKPLQSLKDRRETQETSPSHAEAVNYFIKGTRHYDDLWQVVQFLKRPENLGVHFFGLDILVIRGVGGSGGGESVDRKYIVDVNYLPSYKNEVPARLFPSLLKALMESHV